MIVLLHLQLNIRKCIAYPHDRHEYNTDNKYAKTMCDLVVCALNIAMNDSRDHEPPSQND